MSRPTGAGEIFKWIMYGAVTCLILFAFVMCSIDLGESLEKTKAEDIIRAENGGALPDIEAVNETGFTYDVDRITFEGVNYICFSQGRRMGCVKEESSCD